MEYREIKEMSIYIRTNSLFIELILQSFRENWERTFKYEHFNLL